MTETPDMSGNSTSPAGAADNPRTDRRASAAGAGAGADLALDMSRRDERALAMRIGGADMAAVAARFGWTAEAAHEAIERALIRVTVERNPSGVDHMRSLASARLDALLAGMWPDATNTDGTVHPVVKQGAVKTALSIMDRQSDLYGMKAPTQAVVTHAVDARAMVDVLDRVFAMRSGVQEASVVPAIAGEVVTEVMDVGDVGDVVGDVVDANDL
jgi:hypothetical protein